MSLQVWLPLNGNLNNQGLGTITSVSGTPSFKTSGKISNNALDLKTRITFICPQLANLQTFSIAFWAIVQTSNTLTSSWQDIMGFADVSSSGSGGTFRWETTYSSSNLGIHWHDNATNALVNGSHNHNTVKEQWVHCCVVFDQVAGKLYSYDNGIKTQTHNHLNGKFNNTGTFYLGETNNIEGMIQDVRIYDHALSDKEVEEISKGLVLHYKLDGVGSSLPNLAYGTSEISTSSASYKWINNGSTDFVIENLGGSLIHYSGTVSNSKYIPSIATNTSLPCEFGKTYIYSGKIKVDQDIVLGSSIPLHYWAGARNTDVITNISCNGNLTGITISYLENHSGTLPANTWATITTKFTFPASASNSSYPYPALRLFIYGSVLATAYTGTVNVWIQDIKVEEGDTVTNWCPNVIDPQGIGLGYNTNIIYDSSGQGNNGTKNGTLNSLTNSPKYNIALSGTGTITTTIPALASLLAIGKQYTLACWAKPTGTNESGWVIKMGNNSCGLWWAKSAARWVWNENDNGKRVIGTPIADDYTNWHHLVTTVDKTTATAFIAKHYVDGLPATGYAQQTWDNGSNASPTGTNIVMTLTNADLSDVRLYSTCLTDEQILELYNTSASIDNLGNIYSREYDEDDNLSITKTGEFKCSVIYDSDELTKASILKTNKQIQGKTLYEY